MLMKTTSPIGFSEGLALSSLASATRAWRCCPFPPSGISSIRPFNIRSCSVRWRLLHHLRSLFSLGIVAIVAYLAIKAVVVQTEAPVVARVVSLVVAVVKATAIKVVITLVEGMARTVVVVNPEVVGSPSVRFAGGMLC